MRNTGIQSWSSKDVRDRSSSITPFNIFQPYFPFFSPLSLPCPCQETIDQTVFCTVKREELQDVLSMSPRSWMSSTGGAVGYCRGQKELPVHGETQFSLLHSPYLCFQGLGRIYCLPKTAQMFPSIPLVTGFWFTGGLKSLKYLLKFEL